MHRRSFVLVFTLAAHCAGVASGQTNGGIAGEVTDNTGGVLPGVTVEASSPALIEGRRAALTDGAGRYLLVDLRPGTYTITFTLPGFSSVVVENQELPAGFTMTIDAELLVGVMTETVTVSGAAPMVDMRGTGRAEVLDREILDAVPTGNTIQSTAQLIPGIKLNRPEVGLTTAAQQTYMSVHGMSSSQVTAQIDGIVVNVTPRNGAAHNYHNYLANQEMVYETGTVTAETSGGGIRINMIPREGGNDFSGQAYFGGSLDRLQADGVERLSRRSVDRGISGTEGIDLLYDLNLAQGGYVVRDKLWFFTSLRNLQTDKKVTGSFHRESGAPRFFEPDPVRLDGRDDRPRVPGIDDNTITNALLRLTYRAGDSNRFSAHLDRIFKDRYTIHGAFDDVGTASYWLNGPLYHTSTAKWTSTISSRLLFEAGWSYNKFVVNARDAKGGSSTHERPAVVSCFITPCYHDDPQQYGVGMHPWYQETARTDADTRFTDRYHNAAWYRPSKRFNYSAALSYVTGSHNFKVGVMNSHGGRWHWINANGDIDAARYRSGVPDEVQVNNLPLQYSFDYGRDLGLYVQDSWNIDRLSVNAGLRWEHMIGAVPETIHTGGRFVPAAHFPRQDNLPNWKDFAPRLGAAYDLFGDASTAVKASWGRYNAANTIGYAGWFHPAIRQHDWREWRDCALARGEVRCATREELAALGFDPEIAFGPKGGSHVGGPRGDYGTNGDDYVQDWEIGPPGTIGFGGASSRPVQDPGGVERPWVSLMNVGLEREIVDALSVNLNWYRRETHDTILLHNRAIAFGDYAPVTIENPCFENPSAGFVGCSSRGIQPLPTLTVYNLDRARKGANDWVVSNIESEPDRYSEIYNGYEAGFNARAGGVTLLGGWTMERNVSVRCSNPFDPNKMLFCDGRRYSIPFLHELKISGSVPLPSGWTLSGSAQFYPAQEATDGAAPAWGGTNQGGELDGVRLFRGNIEYVVPNAVFEEQGLVRTESFSIPLMPPGSLFYDRLTQIDVSLRKTFDVGNLRWDVQADVYNVIDAQPLLNGNNAFGTDGTNLGRASSTMQGRFLQVASHLHW